MKNQRLSTRYLTVCGMFTAVAFIAVLLSKVFGTSLLFHVQF